MSDEADVPLSPDMCDLCDLDIHRCPGCGTPVDHGQTVCGACNDLYRDQGQ